MFNPRQFYRESARDRAQRFVRELNPKPQTTPLMTTMNDKSLMPFGKYKGQPLSSVPASYLLWLWEGNGGPMMHLQRGGLADYIRQNFSAIEKDAPDVIIENRPDVPRTGGSK